MPLCWSHPPVGCMKRALTTCTVQAFRIATERLLEMVLKLARRSRSSDSREVEIVSLSLLDICAYSKGPFLVPISNLPVATA